MCKTSVYLLKQENKLQTNKRQCAISLPPAPQYHQTLIASERYMKGAQHFVLKPCQNCSGQEINYRVNEKKVSQE